MQVYPNVPVVFKDEFPKEFINDVNGWAFSKEELRDNFGKLLTLDIDFGDFCSLNCPHCFRRNNKVDFGKNKLMNYGDLVNLIKDGKKLGLKSVKFWGWANHFKTSDFWNF